MLRSRKFHQQLLSVFIATMLILSVVLLPPSHSGGNTALASQPLPPTGGGTSSIPVQTMWNPPIPIKMLDPLTIITTLPPSPGDLVYKLNLGSWVVGHVGIYTGEFTYSGDTMRLDNAPTMVKLWRLIEPPKEDNHVIQDNKYNMVEANADGVTYRYYQPISLFAKGDIFMGARTIAGEPLTTTERQAIVDFVTAQLGKPYAHNGLINTSGAFQGPLVKGPEQYTCTGLAERAYELIGRDIVPESEEEGWIGLEPFKQFQYTKPIDYAEVEAGTELTFLLEAIRMGLAFNYPEHEVNWDISGKPPQATFSVSPEDNSTMEFVWKTLPTDSGSEYRVTFTATQGNKIATQTITIKVVPATQ